MCIDLDIFSDVFDPLVVLNEEWFPEITNKQQFLKPENINKLVKKEFDLERIVESGLPVCFKRTHPISIIFVVKGEDLPPWAQNDEFHVIKIQEL